METPQVTEGQTQHETDALSPARDDGPVRRSIPPSAESRGAEPSVTTRVRAARWIAVGADVLQILIVPATFGGAVSPVNDVIDVVTAVVMVSLLGWHPALLPAFVAELIPFVGLFPTWTAAALFVTRRRT